MNRELVTDPLGVEDLWADLKENIVLLKASGYKEAMVLFGFGWGEHIYEEEWKDIPMPLDDLETKVKEAESKGFGTLGNDNLYFTIEEIPIRLNYSYEGIIRLSYSEGNDIASVIMKRWLSQGWLTESQRSPFYNR
jgi:hypothetical protein